jgi:uncharacterized protein involved in exopolysaccharide biosynthesis
MNDKTLYDYWMVCYRRRLPVLVVMVTAVLGSVLIGNSLPAIFEARAMFYVPVSAATLRTNAGDTAIPLPTSNQDDAKANIAILKGRDALRAIHEQFPSKSTDALQRDVDFTAGRDGVIHVYVRDRDPQLAANIANAYVGHFNRFLADQMQQRAGARRSVLRARLDELNGQLDDVDRRRREFSSMVGTPTLDEEARELTRERQRLTNQLEELRGSIGVRTAPEARGERTRLSATPAVDELESELTQLDMDIAKARLQALPNHPELIALLQKREIAQAALQQKLRSLNAGDKARAETIIGSLRRVEQRLRAIPEYQERRGQLDRKSQDLRASIKQLESDFEEIALASSNVPLIGINVETAHAPTVPVFPVTWINAVVAALVSALAGLLYALLLEYVDENSRRRAAGAIATGAEHGGDVAPTTPESGYDWVNPETRRVARIQPGWLYEVARNDQGSGIHLFTSPELRAMVMFARQDVAAFMGLGDYAQAWLRTVRTRMILDSTGAHVAFGSDPGWTTSGRLANDENTHVDVYLVKHGTQVWRGIIITAGGDDVVISAAADLRLALLSTL